MSRIILSQEDSPVDEREYADSKVDGWIPDEWFDLAIQESLLAFHVWVIRTLPTLHLQIGGEE